MDEIEDLCIVHRGAWTGVGLVTDVQRLFPGSEELPGLVFFSIDHGKKVLKGRWLPPTSGLMTPGMDDLGLTEDLLTGLMKWSLTRFLESVFACSACFSTGVGEQGLDVVKASVALPVPRDHKLVLITASNGFDEVFGSMPVRTLAGVASLGEMFMRDFLKCQVYPLDIGVPATFTAVVKWMASPNPAIFAPHVKSHPETAVNELFFFKFFRRVPEALRAESQPPRSVRR
jgi:hypothetical protein